MLGEEASPPPDAGASALVDFGTLPFGAIAAVVSQLGPLPSHQAGAALGALRLLSRHWRAAMDDAVAAWHAPPAATADAIARLLHRWRHLRRLTLQHCEVSAAVVDALAHCRRLQELHLCVVALPPASSSLFDMLATLPALRLLHLNPAEGLPPGASLKALAACTALRSLALESLYQQDVAADVAEIVRGTGARLDHLALFRSLRALAVQAQQPCDLGVASRLTSLELRCTYTTDDAFLQLFDSLARLQSLDISSNRNLTDDGFRGITRLAGSLTRLVLEGGHEVSEDGATALASLTRLEALQLGYSNRMSGDSTLPLIAANLTRLTHLDISGLTRACSPRALSHLPLLRRLRRLAARGCRLGQESLASVGGVGSLVELDLRDNPALQALDSLAACRQLAALDASECGLEDAHVVPLLSHAPQLRVVKLGSNRRLTAAVLEALAAGPSRCTLQELELSDARLECDELCALLPQLPALARLDICGNDGRMDPPALLAAAEAAPELHTLLCHGVRLTSAAAWAAMAAERGAPGRRRLLRILPWDSPAFDLDAHL